MKIDRDYIIQNHYTESGFKKFDPLIGKHTKYAYKKISKKVIKDKRALDDQLGKALEILSFCNPKQAHNSLSTQGLVLGKVQSGKTT